MAFAKIRFAAQCLASISALAPAAAFADTAVIGTLQCHVSGGVGLILVENQALDCVYQGIHGGKTSHYIGRLMNVGADIGISGRSPRAQAWALRSSSAARKTRFRCSPSLFL
jgi:hypothetical protein